MNLCPFSRVFREAVHLLFMGLGALQQNGDPIYGHRPRSYKDPFHLMEGRLFDPLVQKFYSYLSARTRFLLRCWDQFRLSEALTSHQLVEKFQIHLITRKVMKDQQCIGPKKSQYVSWPALY